MKPILVYKIAVGSRSPQRAKEIIAESIKLYRDNKYEQIFLPSKDESSVVCIHPGTIKVEISGLGLKETIEDLGVEAKDVVRNYVQNFFAKLSDK